MNLHQVRRMKELSEKTAPRPWVPVGPDKQGTYKIFLGNDGWIAARDMATLEFIALAVEFADSVEIGRQAKVVDQGSVPAQG